LKTKPTQHSAKELRACGIQPDAIICRSENRLPDSIKGKISQFTHVHQTAVFSCYNAESVYLVPLILREEGIDEFVLRELKLELTTINLEKWEWLKGNFLEMKAKPAQDTIICGIVGKYFDNLDSYKSLFEALDVAAIHNKRFVKLKHINGEDYSPSELDQCDCILVPGGFGVRGTEGMISAIKYARTKNIPFFGICLGMHLAVVEYARNVCGIKDAMSQEFEPKTKEPLIYLLTEFLDRQGMVQHRTSKSDMGGTLRLGSYSCQVKAGSLLEKIYGESEVVERHRHRYEFNNAYREVLEKNGLVFGGTCRLEENSDMY